MKKRIVEKLLIHEKNLGHYVVKKDNLKINISCIMKNVKQTCSDLKRI